jgi:hypothetical protein
VGGHPTSQHPLATPHHTHWVERNYGHAVAAYAGHHNPGHHESSTTIYTRAGLDEIATALQTLTAQPHPLATPTSDQRGGAAVQ